MVFNPLEKLFNSLKKTRESLSSGLNKLKGKEISAELIEELETVLLMADLGVVCTEDVINKLKKYGNKTNLLDVLHNELLEMITVKYKANVLETDYKASAILIVGVNGTGKTTSAAKLAAYYTNLGKSVMLIGADTYRPGALVQLKMMCEKSNVEVYGEENNKDPSKIVRNGLKHFENSNLDIILIDTAGRHKQEKDLLDEMTEISKAAEPDLALLVIDGTIGQQCFSQAEAFNRIVPVGGIVITKLDSSAKGGGALAASAATGAQIMYIGTGERIDDLEKFSPTRFVGRLLGMGDIQAVLDLAKRLENEGDDVRMKRISSGKMNMDDFFYQLEEVTKVGSLKGLLDSMPGMSGMVKEDQVDQMEDRVSKWRYIIRCKFKYMGRIFIK